MTPRPDETAAKIREEIEKMLDVARAVESQVKANPGDPEITRADRITIEAKREQLEDVRELLIDAEQTLRESSS